MSTNSNKPIQTFAQALAWVKRNVSVDSLSRMGHKDHKAALMWFFAVREATQGVWSELRVKDIAHLLLNGVPKLTQRMVDDNLHDESTNGPDTELSAATFDIRGELQDFFRAGSTARKGES